MLKPGDIFQLRGVYSIEPPNCPTCGRRDRILQEQTTREYLCLHCERRFADADVTVKRN